MIELLKDGTPIDTTFSATAIGGTTDTPTYTLGYFECNGDFANGPTNHQFYPKNQTINIG